MITQPENTIKLSDEQLLVIEEYKNRLTNLEAEISIATKNLKGIKLENEKAIKEKIANDELLSKGNEELKELQLSKDKLGNDIKEMEGYLANASEEDRTFKTEQAKIATEQTERENVIRDGEAKLAENQEVFKKEKAEFESEKIKLSEFKEALTAIIKTF